jgi:hypothetical protein
VAGKTGYLAGGLVFVNDALGSGFLDDGNGPEKVLSGLIGRVIGHGSPDFFDRPFDLGFVTNISQSFYFALFRPFEG